MRDAIGWFKCKLKPPKNLVGLVGQGKPQSQDFIDELRGLGHTFVQMVSLVCWYPLSFTDPVSGRSSLLLSVLPIVDSRPSWILVSVLGELRSTSRIADILPVCLRLLFGLNTLPCVYRLFWCVGLFSWLTRKSPLSGFTALFVLILVCILFSLGFHFTSVLVGRACISFQCLKRFVHQF